MVQNLWIQKSLAILFPIRIDHDCDDFDTQEDTQLFYEANSGPEEALMIQIVIMMEWLFYWNPRDIDID